MEIIAPLKVKAQNAETTICYVFIQVQI